MTQPDLVSKLREVMQPIVNELHILVDSLSCSEHARDSVRHRVLDEIAQFWHGVSLLGREGQAASLVEGCAEHNIPLVDGRCSKCRDANGNTFVLDMQSKVLLQPSPSDEWWKVEALDVIRHARVDGDVPTWDRWRSCIINGLLGAFNRGQDSMRASQPSPSTPIVTPKEKFVSRDEFNDKIADEAAQSCVDWSDLERRKEALRYIVKQIWNEAITEREASTPIVPGTAGLSAEQVREVIGDPNMKYNQKVADRLNALLGAAKPAEPGVPLIHGRAELDIHDARIRKSVLEEAAQVIEKDCDMWKPQNLDKPIWSWKDMAANHRSMSSAIRALAERPAPAGEVKEEKS